MRYFLFDHQAFAFMAKLENVTFHSRGSDKIELLGSSDPVGVDGERLNAIRNTINHGSIPADSAFPFVLKEETIRQWLPGFSSLRFEGTVYLRSSTDDCDTLTLHSVWSKQD